jgi:arsenate reductase (thioredoxin)
MSSKNHRETVIFVCKNNAGRSQIAESLLRHLYGEYYEVYSAGTDPKFVNPLLVQIMAELGIDMSGAASKSLKDFQGMEFDYVVTLCSEAEESCPSFFSGKKYIHHGFKDPKAFKGTKNDKTELFRAIIDEIREWIEREFKWG